MQELKDNNEAQFADSGGFVSPSGIQFIGASKEKLGQAAACAVKRLHLDVRIAHAAKRAGLGESSFLYFFSVSCSSCIQVRI